jgi:hypothetical protein
LFLRPHTTAAQALLLIASAYLLCVPAAAQTQKQSVNCQKADDIALFSSPLAPRKGKPLRVVATTEQPFDGELSLTKPDGTVAVKSRVRHGGPPYFWFAEVADPVAGTWRATLSRDGAHSKCSKVTRTITIHRSAARSPRATEESVWPVRASWNRTTEDLYSAWIEKLFDAPLDVELSWPSLDKVLRDKSRNFLFDHLGLGEDKTKLDLRPDCADLPYFLRAYFAFKMGLPFGYSKCTRGGGGKAPRCSEWWNIQNVEPPPASTRQVAEAGSGSFLDLFGKPGTSSSDAKSSQPQALLPRFRTYLRTTVANGVHSGSGRTAANDNNTDYYPVPLKQATLRPGTVYADPYGHILVLVKRISQQGDAAGVFLAVDGQPDGTVARKRFWRGNFLFARDPSLGGPGFKHFRPIVADRNGTLRRLTNAEIAKNSQYGDFSMEQSELDADAFYDRMDDVMSPEPLNPLRAMKEAVSALEEQVKARVTSVENGRKYQDGGGAEVGMPNGASIFETTGAWEDFATPSRDLRLLIAIDVVRKFPERVARRPERYSMPAGKTVAEVKTELQQVLGTELAARKFSYVRSDGSQWPLALKDVIDRTSALEMAYNVNDCVELRWGAQSKSDEASTCKRHAPEAQRKKMAQYRPWFHERRRPPRD